MTEWKPYLDDRLILHCSGFVVIKPVDAQPAIPLCCPLCDTMLRTRDDEESFIDFFCCHLCALSWAHPRRSEWKAGWRPTPDQVKAVLATRSPLSMVLKLE